MCSRDLGFWRSVFCAPKRRAYVMIEGKNSRKCPEGRGCGFFVPGRGTRTASSRILARSGNTAEPDEFGFACFTRVKFLENSSRSHGRPIRFGHTTRAIRKKIKGLAARLFRFCMKRKTRRAGSNNGAAVFKGDQQRKAAGTAHSRQQPKGKKGFEWQDICVKEI